MRQKTYLAAVFLTVPLLCGMGTAAQESTPVKISQNGTVKPAKDIGTGKGIAFTLPSLDDDRWILTAIELAVFEKQEGESEWHIYKDDSGKESKRRFIDSPTSYNIQVDFGDLDSYRKRAKYKIAYRYYVESIDDMSRIIIAGGDRKDGWRIVGEVNPSEITEDGFTFYLNSQPEIVLQTVTYTKHTMDGDTQYEAKASELGSIFLPKDAFENGVTFGCAVSDYDSEDILSVRYLLKDADEKTVAEGTLQNAVKADISGNSAKLKLICDDGFGGVTETDWYNIQIDDTLPYVKTEFDDKGYSLKTNALFSNFYIYNDETKKMTSGKVVAHIIKDGEEVKTETLPGRAGMFKLSVIMPDGEYTVNLDIYDNNGNYAAHTFHQTLDNTPPTARYVTDSENREATKYNTWVNTNKKVIAVCSDDVSGLDKCKLVEKKNELCTKEWKDLSENSFTAEYEIKDTLSGVITYEFYCYDRAKVPDRTNNCVKLDSEGNKTQINTKVQIDKNPPDITTSINPNMWYTSPVTVSVSVNDNPTPMGFDDNSGILEKKYAVTTSEDIPTTYKELKSSIVAQGMRTMYLHMYAIDNAGNERYETVKININNACTVSDCLRPTEDYKHTIYYSKDSMYVVKNTAYNTKYHMGLSDIDLTDTLKAKAKLVCRDNSKVYVEKTVTVPPTGSIVRDVSFNIPYTSGGETLPDGVYDIYISVTEIKDGVSSFNSITDLPSAVVVIKRSSPPTPVISSDGGMAEIEYPQDNLPGSLAVSGLDLLYKREYKAVKEGITGVYKNYEGAFAADDVTVTALYTDIAGNTSIASKRIKKSAAARETTNIASTGNIAAVEESRQANVYYIGTRRDKKTGINADVFGFME